MYSGKNKSKNIWVLLAVMLAGVVIGGFIGILLNDLGNSVSQLSFLTYLNYGLTFGFKTPFLLDLGVLTLTLGFTVQFTVCGIIGMFLAAILYRKL